MTPALALILLAALPSGADPAEALARGDAAWARRADGFEIAGRPDAERVAEALAAYEAAVESAPEDLPARFRLLDALWFSGHFVEQDRARRRETFERMADLAEDTVRLAESGAAPREPVDPLRRAELLADRPHAAEAHFWAAVAWGLWGMSHAKAAAGFKGVARRIRDHAAVVAAVDPAHRDGAGDRLLGRLHAATPRVPGFTGWIDRARGVTHLRRALAASRRDPRNALFLGQALLEHEPASREEALALLREAAAHAPDPAMLIEESETIGEARRALAAAGESGP